MVITRDNPLPPLPIENRSSVNASLQSQDDEYAVQAVLGTKEKIVIASGIDAKITKFKLESGDSFKKGDVLVEYDCSVDRARLKEALSRQRVTEKQLNAYNKLTSLGSASDIELVLAKENNEQNKAVISQIKGRLKSCQHIAPWNGRVMRKMASQYEYVQTGRVVMEITSKDPLRAEFLIPSRWLQWLNVNTPVEIYIGETNRTYSAEVINVFGEVDPVSQSIQIIAEMEKYHEDLLPGMSGTASFSKNTIEQGERNGFLGLSLSENGTR
ncbi:MAG: HlyD family efflux transporter periplasmic adaptor subunit [Alphaproteobacteria bacterium]